MITAIGVASCFAAWLVYQWLRRDVIERELFEFYHELDRQGIDFKDVHLGGKP